MSVEHLLHLSISRGELEWRFECPDVDACNFPVVDEDGTPEVPGSCWVQDQAHLWMEDCCVDEVLRDITLDPIRTPIVVAVSLPGLGPESAPTAIELVPVGLDR